MRFVPHRPGGKDVAAHLAFVPAMLCILIQRHAFQAVGLHYTADIAEKLNHFTSVMVRLRVSVPACRR